MESRRLAGPVMEPGPPFDVKRTEGRLMKLYYAVGSSSLTPHIVLIEAGLQFEGIKVDEHSKVIEGGGDYRAINPLGFVPALCLDDNTVITEVAAIVQYIADKAPAKKLAPPNGTVERVKLQSWLSFLSSEMHKGGFSPLFYKGMPEEGKEIFRRRLMARFSHLDRHLGEHEYLMGKDFSVADVHLFVISNWASHVAFDLAPYPIVVSYRKRIAQRRAVRAAMTTEGFVVPSSP
jgi:glutathione S-transferase